MLLYLVKINIRWFYQLNLSRMVTSRLTQIENTYLIVFRSSQRSTVNCSCDYIWLREQIQENVCVCLSVCVRVQHFYLFRQTIMLLDVCCLYRLLPYLAI